ncbi:hypothetical protein TanjilG_22489 [Lupinus angustifolius]|uniref:Saposin B-type domain-containing protein n=1 Tax=Lupinus angustifolius TaxID=3871 RepID=A0A4P1RSA3_LUPAN|nr:PREDICTED: uncharacterized protein LOC109331048 [Lupinus angustifolius]XP_019420878.1 PREDICTED: uncharacterized protein LOC109331048 [Lupinus angustifolius]XP_019420887.1 PREDICTED: uncharacterized protein LOC109331048 [Lupinus angustifolius]OIW17377.1 hypothetical protein TanjilG_22489 [Lupinus angustifolius]
MAERMLLLFLVVLGASWACDSRELPNLDLWSNLAFTSKSGTSELSRIPDVCSLCEEYTIKALHYLNEKKTQNEIIDILHNTCYQFHSFHKKCISLVDYYAPLIFVEVASIQPEEFCNKANLCQNIANISSQAEQNSCGFCKDTVSALLLKLNDPDTQVEIIETLLKVSSTVEKYANKYKMVLKYGALGYVNVEKLLETTDICTTLHACKASRVINHKAFLSF